MINRTIDFQLKYEIFINTALIILKYEFIGCILILIWLYYVINHKNKLFCLTRIGIIKIEK